MDWTGALDWYTDIKFMLSNDTHSLVGLCGSSPALFLATYQYMVPEQITHYRTVFMRVFVPSVYNGFLLYDIV